MCAARREMSRDECRKYLRYLELDAYGSMVSVLRAQGPFTSERQKLLQELARVLHISSERHRAEVRRAVNDERLTQIAEQLVSAFAEKVHCGFDSWREIRSLGSPGFGRLGGPNTGTDWMIEGRRVIPLLPRLKARSAFTTLANSLSLATAAANDRKPRVPEEIEQSKAEIYEPQIKVKLEESSSDTDEILPGDESSNERLRSEQVSPLELDLEKPTRNHEILRSIASRKRKSPSPLPTAPPRKVLVIPSSLGNSNHCEPSNNHTSEPSTFQSKLKPVPNKLNSKFAQKLSGNSSIQTVESSEVKPKSTASNNSSGPGPPETSRKSTLNLHNTAKTGASTKPVNIAEHPRKLGSKRNVIVIQKGQTKGLTLSNARKEVLGKVVIEAQKINGDQANLGSTRSSKVASKILFDLQEATESQVLASPKTVIRNTNARSLKEESNDLCGIDDEETLTGSSENERNDECESRDSLDSIDSLGNAEILIDTSHLTEDVSELELKGSEISLDNVQYLVEGSENFILEETRSPILISQNVINNTANTPGTIL